IQLSADLERGHVFTDRLLHARGKSETLLLGAQSMRDAISDLIPGCNFITRPRLSKLTYEGEKKITRLPGRSAIVAFSTQEVYAIAELIRRQRGGAAVVLGALSPRTRNAQVALYQSGDVEFLVATDAIGMGLNLDVDHVAFSAVRKFDGHSHRNLTPGEIGQIAGRAGRHINDGTFGVTGGCDGLDPDLVQRLETHAFDSVRVLQWRNRKLDFGSLERLFDSLRENPREARLTRARTSDDLSALEAVAGDRDIRDLCRSPAAVSKLWDVCQVPDYRKISGANHAELVASLYKFIMTGDQRIPEDWFAKQVAFADRTDGDIDTLATRIAHIRTWTFVSNRPDWLKDPAHWQERTRAIEDSLSDALHERLTQRFVDRRTSALIKGMRDKDELNADIAEDGAISVENHFVGRLKGFRFTLDTSADGIHEKATRAAATQVLARELGMRARRVAAAQNDAFKLTRNGRILWRQDEIARVEPTEDPLLLSVTLLTDEHMADADKDKVRVRLETWLKDLTADKLKPLVELAAAEDLLGLARGVAFRLKENLGVLKRDTVAEEISALDQDARASLRKFGLRFGAFNIYFPLLLKPAAADLAATLFILKNGAALGLDREQLPELPRPGLTSVAADPKVPDAFYRTYGFHVCGPRAVRLDILERLADLIRPLLAFRAAADGSVAPPKGATGDGGFRATEEMMSILGCSAEELSHVLKSLGFWQERRPVRAPAVPVIADTASVTAEVATAEVAPDAATTVEAAAPEASDASDAAAAAAATAIVAGAETPPAAASAEASAPVAAEPAFEEVWRPRRHHHHRGERQERGDGKSADRGHRRRGGGGRDGQRGGRSDQRNGPSPSAGHAPGAVSAEPGSATAAPTDASNSARADAAAPGRAERPDRGDRSDRGDRGDRRDRDRGGRPAGREGADRSRPRPHGDQRRGDASTGGRDGQRGDRGGRPPHGKGRRDENRPRQPEVITSAPPKRAGVDPDNPFAALAALKAAMDKRGEEPSSR
ncbi:MAG: helicase-related protein, partial [Hyphomicrobium sp.]